MKLSAFVILSLSVSLASSSEICSSKVSGDLNGIISLQSTWPLHKEYAIVSLDKIITTNYEDEITEQSVIDYYDYVLGIRDDVPFMDDDYSINRLNYGQRATLFLILPPRFYDDISTRILECAANIINILNHPKIVENYMEFAVFFSSLLKQSFSKLAIESSSYETIHRTIFELNLPSTRFFLLVACPDNIDTEVYTALLSQSLEEEKLTLLRSFTFDDFKIFSKHWYRFLHFSEVKIPPLKYNGPQRYVCSFYKIFSHYVLDREMSTDDMVEELFTKDWGLILWDYIISLIPYHMTDDRLQVAEALIMYGMNKEAFEVLEGMDLEREVPDVAEYKELFHLQQGLIAFRTNIANFDYVEPEDLLIALKYIKNLPGSYARVIARIPKLFYHAEAASLCISLLIKDIKCPKYCRSLGKLTRRALGYTNDGFTQIPNYKAVRRLVITVFEQGYALNWFDKDPSFFASVLVRFLGRELIDGTVLLLLFTKYPVRGEQMFRLIAEIFPFIKAQFFLQIYKWIGLNEGAPVILRWGCNVKWISSMKKDKFTKRDLMKQIMICQLNEKVSIHRFEILAGSYDDKLDDEFRNSILL